MSKNREPLFPVKLEFSRKHWQPFSWLIRWATWSEWSHVDVIMPDGSYVGARGSGGVVRHQESQDASVKQVLLVYVTQSVYDRFYSNIESQIGKPYDWEAILGHVFRKKWDDADAWFCSELVAWAFSEAGMPLIRAAKNKVTPRDLTLSLFIEECLNG